ncbi:MAG: thioredoxin family protein [Saprospiraceae bacterium]|nr:thioredoxin family protein [Chitinophagia bacterium]
MKLLIYISQWSLVLLLFLSTGLKAGEPLQFTKSYSKALKQAQKEDKLIFCFVYTSWSMPSQRMEETTLKDSLVVQELNAEYVTLYINASRNKDFAKDFEIHVFPSMLVIDKWGNAILRDSGYKSSTQLITMIYKTRSKSRYLRQSIDSLMMDVNSENILATVDSIILYRDEYTAKNIAKRYLDANRKNWGNEVCMQLLSDYFSLDKKYLRYVSKNHQAFFIKFDSIELKENIAFHVFINSLKKDKRGRLKFDYKPLRRWFKRFKFKDIEKIENFVRIKYLLWGRGPSVRSSIKLIENYPETSSESVLYSSVIRILLTENYRRSIDYDELIESIEDTLEEGSYWRYDVLALLYYKIGNQSKVEECIATAKEIADILGEDYTPILDYLKDHIN